MLMTIGEIWSLSHLIVEVSGALNFTASQQNMRGIVATEITRGSSLRGLLLLFIGVIGVADVIHVVLTFELVSHSGEIDLNLRF